MMGIKVTAKKVSDGYKGYWRCKGKNVLVENEINIIRTNEYDAEKDAIIDAQEFSRQNNVAFITEGYTL